MQSSSSTGSTQSAASTSSPKNDSIELAQPNGELFLLYRHLRNRKIFHGYNAKQGTSCKKGYKIPQEYSGKFIILLCNLYL